MNTPNSDEEKRNRRDKVAALALCLLFVVAPGCATTTKTVANTTDQTKRAPFTVEDKDACPAAVYNFTEQDMLRMVAVANVRCAAIEKLTDQAVLAKIAVEDEDWTVRFAAFEKLTDQALLAKIAVEDEDRNARRVAAEKLADQAILAKIAAEDEDSDVRRAAVKKLTDQSALAKTARADELSSLRRAATEKLTDQAVLAKIAVEDKDWSVCCAAIEKLSDQALLAKIAVEDKNPNIRRAATEKIADQAVLAKIARADDLSYVRQSAAEKLTDQAVLAKIAVEDEYWDVRRIAAEKLTDQAVLAKIATDDEIPKVRLAAVIKLTDQYQLANVSTGAKFLDVRVVAISKVTDQALLLRWAEDSSRAAIRQAAVLNITDDGFLLRRLPLEPSAAVRIAIIQALHGKDALHAVALSAYYQESRELALLLLKEKLKDPATDVVAAHNQLKSRVTALTTETDNNKLLALALTGEFDVLRVAATDRLRDPVVLEQVALRADARDVLKAVLAKLEDKAILNRLASNAANLPMRLAAAQKAGSKSWEEIFAAATARGISEKEKTILNQLGADSDDFPRLQEAAQMAGFKSWQEFIAAAPSQDASVQMLGDALAAVSLFPAVQPEAQTGVQQACLNLIRRGDESRIPEMVDLLEGYGDKTLAEDYLNCGQPDLDTAGQAWASKRDYDIGKGSGSSRARWGSGM